MSRFSQLPGEDRLARYQADMVPWMWFLTRTADCRIFQNKNGSGHRPGGLSAISDSRTLRSSLQGTYDPWDYCVQYRETACNFIMRLLEQEGIFFFFRHEKGKHVLVLADTAMAHKPCPHKRRGSATNASFGSGYDRGG